MADETEYRPTQQADDDKCVCCGTTRRLLWKRDDHALAVATICVECKFGACEVCRGE